MRQRLYPSSCHIGPEVSILCPAGLDVKKVRKHNDSSEEMLGYINYCSPALNGDSLGDMLEEIKLSQVSFCYFPTDSYSKIKQDGSIEPKIRSLRIWQKNHYARN